MSKAGSDDGVPRERPKVFGIGFHKTATTSLGDALSDLGYRVTGPNGVRRRDISEETAWDLAQELVPRFDAFQDNPWPLLYERLDDAYPGSRFILTVRDADEWLSSVVRHFGSDSTPMRTWIYGVGSPLGNETVYMDRYRRHNETVVRHFAGRDDLLIMRITEGDGWPELCAFLAAEIPDAPFPHSNPRESRMKQTRTASGLLRRVRRGLGRA